MWALVCLGLVILVGRVVCCYGKHGSFAFVLISANCDWGAFGALGVRLVGVGIPSPRRFASWMHNQQKEHCSNSTTRTAFVQHAR
eukprot:1307623-Prymnesium_polylepis.1